MLTVCTHETPADSTRACHHLFESETKHTQYHRRFTGRGVHYGCVCRACARDPALDRAALRPLCAPCVAALEDSASWSGIAGEPEVRARATGFRFEHRVVRISGAPDAPLLDLRPVDGLQHSVWIALARDGGIYRLDLDRSRFDLLGELPPCGVYLDEPVSVALDRRGSMAAVVNDKGMCGVVLDLESCSVLLELQRGDYCVEHCHFPVAFFEYQRRTLLVHGTDWNQLEITDPRTGRLLTARELIPYTDLNHPPPHDLNYFHGALVVSPDGAWVVDNGWVWHPAGVVRSWSLRAWLEGNVYESEDGPTVREVCWQEPWDVPMCWVGERELAVSGYGEDEPSMLAAARVFDVVTGRKLRWFPGPRGEFVFDRYLFALSETEGTTVWDVATGERLHHAPGLHPTRYHRGAREFLTPLPEPGAFLRSTLVDPGHHPAG